MADIFFSYKSDERDRVAPIVTALETKGWTVFWDRKTPVGISWSEHIRENLEQVPCVLVTWTIASIESHWVEIEEGKGRDRRCLVPLKLDEVTPPFGFEHIQAADFTRWSGDTGSGEWKDLIAAIERHVPRPSAPPSEADAGAARPEPPSSKDASPRDTSELWDRLSRNPSPDELERLATEVETLRQENPTDPGLIKLQRRISAVQETITPKAAWFTGPWIRLAAGSAILVLAAVVMNMKLTAPKPPPKTSGSSGSTVGPVPTAARSPASTSPTRTSVEGIALPELVDIPAGCFQMGSPPGAGDDDEHPQHQVCLDAYQIGRHEVTFDQYDAYARANKVTLPKDLGWGRGRRPVIKVSWRDAQDYVQWLSKQIGRSCSLPSEAQWEYAARAGTTTAYALPAPSGSDDIKGQGLANCSGCGGEWDDKNRTAPVGRFPANAWGLYDMHGNVWEWVQDHYHTNYDGAPADGSPWEDEGSNGPRALRGGSWNFIPENARASLRYGFDPDDRYYGVGFRVLCSSPISR